MLGSSVFLDAVMLQQRQLELVSRSRAEHAVCVEGRLNACTGGPRLSGVLCRIGRKFSCCLALLTVVRLVLQLRQLKLCLAWAPALHATT